MNTSIVSINRGVPHRCLVFLFISLFRVKRMSIVILSRSVFVWFCFIFAGVRGSIASPSIFLFLLAVDSRAEICAFLRKCV